MLRPCEGVSTSFRLAAYCSLISPSRLPEALVSIPVERPGRIDMPRASWRGHLRLSLVSCPIYLLPATERTKPIRLHQVWGPPLADDVVELKEHHTGLDVLDRPASRLPPEEVEDQPVPVRPATRITLRPHDSSTGEELEKRARTS